MVCYHATFLRIDPLKVLLGFQSRLTPSPVRCEFFEKLPTHFQHLTSKQDSETDSLISEDFTLEVVF